MTNDFNNTENRFTKEYSNEYAYGFGFFDNGKRISMDNVVDLLNELNNENTHIKQTIQDMINTERTAIGKSVLKQLWEAIQ